MISSKNDFDFVKLTIRSIFILSNKKIFFLFKNGHFLKQKEINNYLKINKVRKLHLGATRNISGF